MKEKNPESPSSTSSSPRGVLLFLPEGEVFIPQHIAEMFEENARAYFAQQLLRMTPEDRQSIFAYLEHFLRKEKEKGRQMKD